MWGVEVEVGQSQGAREPDWEPVDLVHGRVDERGLVKTFVSNRDLLAKLGAEIPTAKVGDAATGGFSAHEVFPGSRANTVPGGRRRTDNPRTVVYLSVATGGKQSMRLEIPVHLPNHDVASLGGRGTTVHVKQADIVTSVGSNLGAVAEEGDLVVGLQIGNERWQMWGAYNLVEQREADFFARTYQRARKGTTSLTRRALGHEEVVRIRGRDRNGILASITFRRMSRDMAGGDVYQVRLPYVVIALLSSMGGIRFRA